MGKYIGVDLGGTNVLAGLIDNGKIISKAKNSTNSNQGLAHSINQIIKCIEKTIRKSGIKQNKIKAIGFGAAGQIDTKNGIIISAPNLENWNNIQIKSILEKHFKIPVAVLNDVGAGTIGEFKYGAGKNIQNGLCIFIGTGIGGGIIVDKKLYSGKSGIAGELGHVIIHAGSNFKCGCGNKGCFESLASRSAIVRNINNNIDNGKSSIVVEMSENLTKVIKSKIISSAYYANDPLIVEIMEKELYYIGLACANYMNIFNPEVIILGGGLINAFQDDIFEKINFYAKQHALSKAFLDCNIIPAKLGDYAGITGAAIYAEKIFK